MRGSTAHLLSARLCKALEIEDQHVPYRDSWMPDLLAGNYLVKLGSRAFDVLATLVERRGRVVPQYDLRDLMLPRPVLEQKPTLGDSMPQCELAFKDGCLLCAASGNAEPIPTQGDL